MAFFPILFAVAAATTAVATVAQANAAQKSSRAQQRSVELQQRQQELAAQRSRRQAIREMQIRRATALSTSQGAGTITSSGAAGGIGALSSQTGEQLGFSTQMSGLSRQISSANQAALSAEASAARWSGIGSIGGDLMTFSYNRSPQVQNFFARLE